MNPVTLNTIANSLLSVLGGNHSKLYLAGVEIRLQTVGCIISSQENSSKRLFQETLNYEKWKDKKE